MIDRLKSYFASQKKPPFLIKDVFGDSSGKLHLQFVFDELSLFNDAILKIGKADIRSISL